MIVNKIDETPPLSILMALIEKAVFTHIESSWEKEKNELMKRIDSEKHQAIAGITLRIMKQVNISQSGTSIIIQVIEKKP